MENFGIKTLGQKQDFDSGVLSIPFKSFPDNSPKLRLSQTNPTFERTNFKMQTARIQCGSTFDLGRNSNFSRIRKGL